MLAPEHSVVVGPQRPVDRDLADRGSLRQPGDGVDAFPPLLEVVLDELHPIGPRNRPLGLDLGLEFRGFSLPDARVARFRLEHPEANPARDLEAWADFEDTYPRTFAGMYQFWCWKPG